MLTSTGNSLDSSFVAVNFEIAQKQLRVIGNSDVLENGGLNVTNDVTCFVADGAAKITLAPTGGSPPPSLTSAILHHVSIDAVFSFGSRVTICGNVGVRSLVCDGTALLRGAASCPKAVVG